MSWYEVIKRYYDTGEYTVEQLHTFVSAKWITEEEYKKIIAN
jgi:uncharacterized XkdX family phage protein